MTRISRSNWLGLVIAGGKSQRMGLEKATLRLPNGLTLREAACTKVRALCDLVRVVGAQEGCDLPDAIVDAGPLGGLLAGLELAQREGKQGVLTLPLDTPLVREEDLRALVNAQNSAPVLWLRAGEAECPLAARVEITVLDDLWAFLESGKRSVLRFFEALGAEAIDLGEASKDRLRNANTPQEWQELLAIWPQITQEANGCQ